MLTTSVVGPRYGYLGLGQAQGRVTQMQLTAALQQLSRAENTLGEVYTQITLLASLGGVPNVLIDSYSRGAVQVNRLLDEVAAQAAAAGAIVAGPPIPLPTMQVVGPVLLPAAAAAAAGVAPGPVAAVVAAGAGIVTAASLRVDPCGGVVGGGFSGVPAAGIIARKILQQWGGRLLYTVILGGTVYLTADKIGVILHSAWGQAEEIERFRASAVAAEEEVRRSAKIADSTIELMKQCVGDRMGDPAVYAICLEKIEGVVRGIADGKIEPPKPSKGLGLFGYIGLAVFMGAVGLGGFWVYRRYRGAPKKRARPAAEPEAAKRRAAIGRKRGRGI